MQEEVIPAVPVDEQNARTFAEEVLDRFRNPFIVHPLISITLQYTSKMKMRNVQTIINYLKKFAKVPKLFTIGFATYLLFMKAVKEENGKYVGERDGKFYPINDDSAAYFYKAWQGVDIAQRASIHQFVQTVLSDTSVWGTDLNKLSGFAGTITENLSAMLQNGVKATLQQNISPGAASSKGNL